ncbi:MAG: hypothetical protein AB8G14_11690 [Ilumatobacter sp.]
MSTIRAVADLAGVLLIVITGAIDDKSCGGGVSHAVRRTDRESFEPLGATRLLWNND